MKKPACLGDPTTHGGRIVTASSTFSLDDRKAALLGDLVSCPLHGDNELTEAGEGMTDEGKPMIMSGCHSRCGSMVLPGESGVSIE
ncbi:hypothetical protein R75461_07640 [Paraburkholderia nemoris]|uniref:PAAR domain-containing protein n=1 Tax=Paraburkholderia nemoris TaxID=2793076 RepID=UPI00190DB9D1|nr:MULTISPECIES: PAAR domain-containing protein [Paraburkholderia]MBK3786410.1 PAAR domain-containing protein [Paraburkholderia aspalathi]CAE6854518.1 hypothetical protein R75461_07640 [Paraburkholderia nemoris]